MWCQRRELCAVNRNRMQRIGRAEFRGKSGRCPQAKSGMGNEEYFFTIDGVEAIVHFGRVVARDGAGQIGIAESYAFCLLPAQATGAISDAESGLPRNCG